MTGAATTTSGQPAADLDGEVRDPPGDAIGAVIWLHGMGQDGASMRAVSRRAGLEELPIRHVYLNAPHRDVGVIQSAPARSWMSQRVSDLEVTDPGELRRMAQRVRGIIDREANVVGSHRVVLAGFSQGAAMALMLGLTHTVRLAGVAVYAPFLMETRQTVAPSFEANRGMPIWIGHGEQDWTIPLAAGLGIRDGLRRRGYAVEWHTYAHRHTAFAGAQQDLNRFITELLE